MVRIIAGLSLDTCLRSGLLAFHAAGCHFCPVWVGHRSECQVADNEHLGVEQEIRASVELVRKTKVLGRLPVVNFAAGGVATPADAALMMQVQICPLCALRTSHISFRHRPDYINATMQMMIAMCNTCRCRYMPVVSRTAICTELDPVASSSWQGGSNADGHGRCVRGIWHLQVWRCSQARPRDCAGAFSFPRCSSGVLLV